MNVLIACEYSGAVRDAFKELGHYAVSCDLLPTEKPGHHYQGDVFDVINEGWDLMIAHPPCTYLSNSGVRWLYSDPERWKEMIKGAVFFRKLLEAPIPRIAIENPVMHGYAKEIIGVDQSQSIQPYEFGHGEQKRTCLWLKNLPLLQPTNIVEGREQRIWKLSPGDDRWKERSRTFEGIAKAMAEQWGQSVQMRLESLLLK